MNYPDKLFGNLHFEVDEGWKTHTILPVYTNTPSVYLVEKPLRVQSAVTQLAETVSIMMHQKCRTDG